MNQIVQEADIISAVPIPAIPKPAMTRREKLLRWAELVREFQYPMELFHGLEFRHPSQLGEPYYFVNPPHASRTPFGLAFCDPMLTAAGLKSTTESIAMGTASVKDAMNFFELSQAQLHDFSCDCGGHISNADMANRIERLA